MKQAKIMRNRVIRPKLGSIKHKVWEISDSCYQAGVRRLRAEVLRQCVKEGIQQRTASAEHCAWRRFIGLVNNYS